MDEGTILLSLLGGVLAVLLISIVLQMMMLRNLKELHTKLKKMQVVGPATPLAQPDSADLRTRDIEPLLSSHGSIEESLRALGETLHLSSLTLASRDGLVVASTASEAQEDAAQYSDTWNKGKEPADPRIRVFGIPHRSGTLVGISRSEGRLNGQEFELLKENIGKILNYWL